MRYQGLSLSGAERRAIAEYLTGRAVGGDLTGAATGRCTMPPPLADQGAGPSWNGWGPTLQNTHFQSTAQAGITAAQVPHLVLKWAFGFPDTTSAWAQPAIVGGRLFVGSQNGTVYSLDPFTGCVIWTFTAEGGVRASVSIARLKPAMSAASGAYFSWIKRVCLRARCGDWRPDLETKSRRPSADSTHGLAGRLRRPCIGADILVRGIR